MKKSICMLIVISCLLLTGCGEKQCVKWETTTSTTDKLDCSDLNGSSKYNCEFINEQRAKKDKTTQECVAWEE